MRSFAAGARRALFPRHSLLHRIGQDCRLPTERALSRSAELALRIRGAGQPSRLYLLLGGKCGYRSDDLNCGHLWRLWECSRRSIPQRSESTTVVLLPRGITMYAPARSNSTASARISATPYSPIESPALTIRPSRMATGPASPPVIIPPHWNTVSPPACPRATCASGAFRGPRSLGAPAIAGETKAMRPCASGQCASEGIGASGPFAEAGSWIRTPLSPGRSTARMRRGAICRGAPAGFDPTVLTTSSDIAPGTTTPSRERATPAAGTTDQTWSPDPSARSTSTEKTRTDAAVLTDARKRS